MNLKHFIQIEYNDGGLSFFIYEKNIMLYVILITLKT